MSSGGLSVTNVVDGADEDDYKPVQYSSQVSHAAAHHCLNLKVINKKVGVLPDVEQGPAGEQHPPGHICWQLCWLLVLADEAQSSVLEGELPDLICCVRQWWWNTFLFLELQRGKRLFLCLLSFCSYRAESQLNNTNIKPFFKPFIHKTIKALES